MEDREAVAGHASNPKLNPSLRYLLIEIHRIRRIKCDETKPACSKCLTSGRSCDGYGILIKTSPTSKNSSLASLDVHCHRSERENRGFDYFRHKAVSELMGFDTKSEFWSHVVLQFSEASSAVFRAVMSLSSLHEIIYGEPRTGSFLEDRLSFLRQYNKAIRQLCSRHTAQPIQFTLTCCILFICLENLRGDYDAALLHLEKGLEVLKEWDVQEIDSGEVEARNVISRVFQRLDMQATTFLDSRQPRYEVSPRGGTLEQTEKKALVIVDLQQARTVLDVLVSRLFYIVTARSNHQHPSWSIENEYLPARKPLLHGLSTKFADWKSAFDLFSLQESPKWQREELQLSVLLALHHRTTSLMLDIRLDTDTDGIYRGVPRDAEWENIIGICESMINSMSAPKPSFSVDVGLIAPLYFTAMQANNTRTCQRAIELLYRIKWKEGFWDAGTAARIAEKILHNQITGTSGRDSTSGIAALAKIHV